MPTAFDKYAETYDNHFTNTLIGEAQRNQVYRVLEKYLIINKYKILEINCGTGEDACWLVHKGHTVLATDLSNGMIEVAKQKNNSSNVEFRLLNCLDIATLKPNTFDFIFSNFGGLNCLTTAELTKFADSCNNIQNSNNYLAFVIMSSNCWWETFYFNRKKDFNNATRRQNKQGIDTVIEGITFKTYYYSPQDVETIFSKHYQVIETKPIGLFVPPSYLEPYFKNRKVVFKCLVLLDKLVSTFSFLSNRADHYLIVLKKK